MDVESASLANALMPSSARELALPALWDGHWLVPIVNVALTLLSSAVSVMLISVLVHWIA
jgi:hypothetical protein